MSGPALSAATMARLEELFRDFPRGPAALIPGIFIVQEEENRLTPDNLSALADLLDMPKSHVYQTATFYALFSFAPQGKHVIRLCRSICCYLRGSDALQSHAEKSLGIKAGETTADGLFTLHLAECLAACDRAPAMMIDDKVYGPLTPEDFDRIVGEYR